ncbi:hypothetical protein TNCV_3305951 [Trichonephila clavipes]|nr:hypothetical protein TNCV_3305951 [Trichonephila clavipes]
MPSTLCLVPRCSWCCIFGRGKRAWLLKWGSNGNEGDICYGSEHSDWKLEVSQLFTSRFTRWTDVHPAPEILTRTCTYQAHRHDQEKGGTEQDVEHPPSNEKVTTEVVTPKKTPPHPIMLKIKDNFREQIKCISEKCPNLRNRIVNDVVKMFSNDHEEYRTLIHFLESDKEFEFYVIKRQNVKPIKAVIKGLPSSSKITDITNDLAEIGFKIYSCTQLTSKRTKKSLPYFLVILPRNDFNSKIFDIAKLGYLQMKVEGYLVRGITIYFGLEVEKR